MKIKVGDIVKNAVLTSKLSKGDIVEKLQKSRTWLTNVLDQEYMSMKYVIQIGKVLDVDFTKSIPELSNILPSKIDKTIIDEDADLSNIELRDKIIQIQEKYVVLLEQYIKLLEKVKKQE